MLTPADVEQKTFSTALRGYDLDEVDDFLDEVVATLRELTEQLDQARLAGAGVEAVVTPVLAPAPEPEPVIEPKPEPEPEPEPAPELEPEPEEPITEAPSPRIDESAIGRALVAAQTAADRLLEDAQSEAGRIVDEAKTEADSWTAEREEKKREAEAEIAALTARVASVRSELSVLADEVAEKLDEMDSVIEGSGDTETGPDVESDGDGDGDDHKADVVAIAADPEEDTMDGGEADDDVETGHGYDSGNGADHLDEILTGVANDLQLDPADGSDRIDEPGEQDRESDDEDDEDE